MFTAARDLTLNDRATLREQDAKTTVDDALTAEQRRIIIFCLKTIKFQRPVSPPNVYRVYYNIQVMMEY